MLLQNSYFNSHLCGGWNPSTSFQNLSGCPQHLSRFSVSKQLVFSKLVQFMQVLSKYDVLKFITWHYKKIKGVTYISLDYLSDEVGIRLNNSLNFWRFWAAFWLVGLRWWFMKTTTFLLRWLRSYKNQREVLTSILI